MEMDLDQDLDQDLEMDLYQDNKGTILFDSIEQKKKYILKNYRRGLSLNEIGDIIEQSPYTVRYHLVQMGEKLRPQGGSNRMASKKPNEYKLVTRVCEWLIDYPCLICGKRIEIGESYHMGEYHRRYHQRCVDAK